MRASPEFRPPFWRGRRVRHAPTITMDTTSLVVRAIRRWGSQELRTEILPLIASGDVRICLGYTETPGPMWPRRGPGPCATATPWVIEGQKMFTTGAQFCHYSFLWVVLPGSCCGW